MRGSDKTALAATVVGTLAVSVVGTALSVLLNGFVAGFVALGALCLVVATVALWKPIANRVLKGRDETAVLSAGLEDFQEYLYEWAEPARPGPGAWLVVLVVVLLGLVAGVGFSLVVSGDDSRQDRSVVSPDRREAPQGRGAPSSDNTDKAPLRAEPPRQAPSSAPKTYALEPKGSSGGSVGAGGGSSSPPALAESGGRPPREETTVRPAPEAPSASSPLVPILIAIAVLAAISIGVVVLRQRRQRDRGSPTEVHR
ncbi:MAG TPA: hypothetical protein VFI03_07635 [Solirubrobacterales bacterium]|nr:hypothetical protein [Solirubrobacterales bacterium]